MSLKTTIEARIKYMVWTKLNCYLKTLGVFRYVYIYIINPIVLYFGPPSLQACFWRETVFVMAVFVIQSTFGWVKHDLLHKNVAVYASLNISQGQLSSFLRYLQNNYWQMKWAMRTTRYFPSFWMVYSTNSLTSKSKMERPRTMKRCRLKPGDRRDFTREYLQWNNEETFALQSETWKICCSTLLALE